MTAGSDPEAKSISDDVPLRISNPWASHRSRVARVFTTRRGFRSNIAARPEVPEIHQVAGAHCYLLTIRFGATRAVQRFLTKHVSDQSDVLRTETVIVLETIKETSELGLRGPWRSSCSELAYPSAAWPAGASPIVTFCSLSARFS
jgi:DNA-binding Lrp family transcriptional regulator